jgi:hypothetical protein
MASQHHLFPIDGSFDPETVRVLTDAFQAAWQALQTNGTTFDGQSDAARELLAKGIIHTARLGERDQRKLRDAALAYLAEVNLQGPPRGNRHGGTR